MTTDRLLCECLGSTASKTHSALCSYFFLCYQNDRDVCLNSPPSHPARTERSGSPDTAGVAGVRSAAAWRGLGSWSAAIPSTASDSGSQACRKARKALRGSRDARDFSLTCRSRESQRHLSERNTCLKIKQPPCRKRRVGGGRGLQSL